MTTYRTIKKQKSPPFVMLEKRELIQTQAYISLSGSALKVYIFFRGEAVGHLYNTKAYCPLDKEIIAAYAEIITATGLSRKSVRNAILELEGKGFINMIEQGGLKSGGFSKNVYTLSTRFYKWNTEQFIPGVLKKEKNVIDRGFGLIWDRKKQKASKKSIPA